MQNIELHLLPRWLEQNTHSFRVVGSKTPMSKDFLLQQTEASLHWSAAC